MKYKAKDILKHKRHDFIIQLTKRIKHNDYYYYFKYLNKNNSTYLSRGEYKHVSNLDKFWEKVTELEKLFI